MLSGEFLSLFWKYLQFNTEGDITGISEDAPDEAKKAFRHYMKLMQAHTGTCRIDQGTTFTRSMETSSCH